MKCLSIRQPYAELIISGAKRVEYRNWNTEFRGQFLVHASKTPDRKVKTDLPVGVVIGKVTLYSVRHFKNRKKGYQYGFLLKNPQRFKKPIPMSGQLRFFDVTVLRHLDNIP
jgi:ASCH domain